MFIHMSRIQQKILRLWVNIYFLKDVIKFYGDNCVDKHRSLAYATGLLTYRLGHNEWGLYNSNNFMSCLGTAALFVFIAAILIRFFREVQE